MKIDKRAAIEIMEREATRADRGELDLEWVGKVEELSRLCDEGISKTHLAFLGTAMLAKAYDRRADLYAIKPQHATSDAGAFSARVLCHSVLVPMAAELGINIGVTGREPLNNQPYFRMTRLDDGTPVHKGGRAAFDYMLGLIKELQSSTEDEAASALRAFIAVRQKYQVKYGTHDAEAGIPPHRLASIIQGFVSQNSENGRRAQAIAAGLMDAAVGNERVESGRINDPSRKHPGDVCVAAVSDPENWEKAIEVRDKPVSGSDVQIFGKKCLDMGVREAAVLMVAEQQEVLAKEKLQEWASEFGLGLTLFQGWGDFVDQTLFWCPEPKPSAVGIALSAIHDRLIAVEASSEAISLWQSLIADANSADREGD